MIIELCVSENSYSVNDLTLTFVPHSSNGILIDTKLASFDFWRLHTAPGTGSKMVKNFSSKFLSFARLNKAFMFPLSHSRVGIGAEEKIMLFLNIFSIPLTAFKKTLLVFIEVL